MIFHTLSCFLISALAIRLVSGESEDVNDFTTVFNKTLTTPWQIDDEGPYFNSLAVHQGTDGILATRLDDANIWYIDAAKRTGVELVPVPGANATSGITAIKDDVYLFAAGNYSPDKGIFFKETFGIWKLDLTNWDVIDPEPVLVLPLRDVAWGRATVLSAWNETHALMAGGIRGVMYLLNIETESIDGALPFGFASVHAMRVEEKSVYFTVGEGDLFSVAINAETFLPEGDPESINSGLQLRAFDTADDGIRYATSSSYGNSIVRVTREGSTKLVGDLSGTASRSALATGKTPDDIIKLYVSTMQSPDGSTPAKILCFDLGPAEAAVDPGVVVTQPTYTLAPEGGTPTPSKS